MKIKSVMKIFLISSIVLQMPVFSFQISGTYSHSQSKQFCWIPKTYSDGLEAGSPVSKNLIVDKLELLTNQIRNKKIDYPRTLLITKGKKLIYEKYFFGAKRHQKYAIFSVSKPFTSAIVGIAIDKGYIKSVELPIAPFFPEHKSVFKNDKKSSICIKHLLTLSSGFEWDEGTYSYEDLRNTHVQMETKKDWVKFILTRQLKNSPGTDWEYNTGNTQILSAIIKKTSGLFLHQFAQKYFFEPLNIIDYYWNCDPRGYTCAGGSDGGLRIKARDFIKLGMLYLNNGIWNNKRIISEQWIQESTKPYIKTRKNGYYGYLWHIAKEDKKSGQFSAFYHSGSGGHFLIVFPSLEMVIAWNSKISVGKSLLLEILKIFRT